MLNFKNDAEIAKLVESVKIGNPAKNDEGNFSKLLRETIEEVLDEIEQERTRGRHRKVRGDVESWKGGEQRLRGMQKPAISDLSKFPQLSGDASEPKREFKIRNDFPDEWNGAVKDATEHIKGWLEDAKDPQHVEHDLLEPPPKLPRQITHLKPKGKPYFTVAKINMKFTERLPATALAKKRAQVVIPQGWALSDAETGETKKGGFRLVSKHFKARWGRQKRLHKATLDVLFKSGATDPNFSTRFEGNIAVGLAKRCKGCKPNELQTNLTDGLDKPTKIDLSPRALTAGDAIGEALI